MQRETESMNETERKRTAEANVFCSYSCIQMEVLMEAFFLRRLCFSSTSHHLNTVSLSVPSPPDGPWPSQPYLHLLAGPTSYHRGRLLAGNTRLHSLWSFIFYRLLSTEMRVWKNPYRASLSLSLVFFIYKLWIPAWFFLVQEKSV